MSEVASASTIQSAITDEIFFALGLKHRGLVRRALGWVFALPTRHFARHMAAVDVAIAKGGAPAGCRVMMERLDVDIRASGVEHIPTSGPVMLLATHPGAYDSMAIGSLVPRTDLKVIATGTRLYSVMPNLRPNVFFVKKGDVRENMMTLRNAIEHLRQGGTLLQFGSGRIEPDPATDPVGDGIFAKWSPSLEIILRKAPETTVIPTVPSGVLLKRFRDSPLTRLRKENVDRRRLGEFIQILQQLAFPKSVEGKANISFGEPFRLADLEAVSSGQRVMAAAIARVKETLAEHRNWISKLEAE
ncbi:hypothetical protein JR338_01465 [Chloroflexota bacterium]|nr:hypothetical protein JR338_01465 [Chloroflexota bacterium]